MIESLVYTNDKRHRSLHVVGEGQRTHGDVGALPGEGEENGAKSLADGGEEGGPGRGEDNLLLQDEEGVEGEEGERVQSGQERPVGRDTETERNRERRN